MAENINRLVAVIAALEKVRGHIGEYPGDAVLAPSAYNRWIGMLDGAINGEFEALKIDDDPIPAFEYLMHLDAAIAFLTELLPG